MARSGLPGRDLEKTNIMALGAKGRAGMRETVGQKAVSTERVTCTHGIIKRGGIPGHCSMVPVVPLV